MLVGMARKFATVSAEIGEATGSRGRLLISNRLNILSMH
jgi:hypothetical protein